MRTLRRSPETAAGAGRRSHATHSARTGVALVIALLGAAAARGDPWLPPGEPAIRHDLQLLADAGVLRGPSSTWPLSWGDIANDLSRAQPAALDPVARASLLRLAERMERTRRARSVEPHLSIVLADEPRRLRTFENTGREGQEVEAGVAWTGLRMSYRLQASVVGDPADGEDLRGDGSYVGVAAGNWMFAAGLMDRWWGPGWDGSLILSSNARPMPTVSVNRNLSGPFQPRWLRWVGPWSATAVFGLLESDRDVPNAQYFASRVAFRPVPSLEIGLQRAAQWCGEGRPCDLETFMDLLLGNDTRGVTTTRAEEPGNQLAGADLRWTGAPHGRRYAVYGQMIGEDIAGGAPSKFTGLYGVERWGVSERLGGSYRWHLEMADTAVDFLGTDQFNVAYEHAIYTDGYRYRGRAIGHSMDGDGRMLSFGAMLLQAHERTWNALLQVVEINRDGTEKGPHSVSATAADLLNVEIGYGRPLGNGTLGLSVGFERFEHKATGAVDDSPRFFLQWRSAR